MNFTILPYVMPKLKMCTMHLYFPLHLVEWYLGTQITFDIPNFTYEGEKQGRINKIYSIMQYISVNKV
jgi:hypothetical protein